MNNCFSIYHTSRTTSGPKSNFICDNIPTKAILVFLGCSEVNSTWLTASELASAREKYYSLVWYILTHLIESITKISIVIGSPRAYLSRSRRAITWVSDLNFCNRIPVIGYPRDFYLNYARFNGFICNVCYSF